MTSVLDGELAEQITDALTAADIPQAAVITHDEVTGPPFDPVITPVPYACSGWIDVTSEADRAGGLVEAGDVRAFVVASSIAITPAPGDRVQVAGGTTYVVVSVDRDPARALWDLRARA